MNGLEAVFISEGARASFFLRSRSFFQATRPRNALNFSESSPIASSSATSAGTSRSFVAAHMMLLSLRRDRLDAWALQKHLAISPNPLPTVGAPQTHWTKVLFAVVGTGSKIILDYVTRRLDALSAGLKNRLEGINLR